MLASPAISRPRPPSQTRRSTASPARQRTQSHTPSDAPPPYKESDNRHSLTEIDDMLNVAGSVVRNRERELDAAALASRSLLEQNKLMFAKREALLARLPISPRTSFAAPERHATNRSSSWSTCSDDSDMDTGTPRRDTATPTPDSLASDSLEAHRIVTPTHSASGSLDLGSPPQPPAARLAPTTAERLAALHAGLVSPVNPRPAAATPRRVSVSPAAVNTLQEANAALLARVQELEETTTKAHTDGAARMRRLQAEAESLRQRLGEAEKANEGLRIEAEREREKQRVRAQSAGARQHRKQASIEEEPVPPVPRDFAPGATWRPEFRSLRGNVRPARAATATASVAATVSRGSRVGPARAQSTAPVPTARPPTTPPRTARTQSNATPPRNPSVSPMKHTPVRPSRLRHQRANSFAGLGKSMQSALEAARSEMNRVVSTVVEEATDIEAVDKPSPTRLHHGVLPFPSVGDEPPEDMSFMSTQLLAQELVAKINELSATNEEILQQRDHLKHMLEAAEAEADELKRVCERLEHEVEHERSGGGSESEGRHSAGEGRKKGSVRGLPGLQLEIPALGLEGLGSASAGGGALQDLAAELGAELQDETDVDAGPRVDLASELMMAGGSGESKPSTPTTRTSFGNLGLGHPSAPANRTRQVSTTSVKPAPASTKRGLGNRGLASRAKTHPRRVRKSLSSVVFTPAGKAPPSPVSSPTAPSAAGPSIGQLDSPMTPAKNKTTDEGFATPRSEFLTPRSDMAVTPPQQEAYLTPASTLRIPGSLSRAFIAPSPTTDDEDASELPSPVRPKAGDSTMAQLRAALDPLFNGVVQGKASTSQELAPMIRRKPSNLRLIFSKDEPLEPWEAKLRDLYSEINKSFEDDPGMSSAGEDGWRGSRRARALGRMSLRRRAAGLDDGSDYAADDSEVGDRAVRKSDDQAQATRFELARKLQQKSMSTFLEVLLLVQFAVVLVVFVYTAVRRGPKAVLGAQQRQR